MLHDPQLTNEAEGQNFTELAMFGERCSGLTYVEHRMTETFPGLSMTHEYGWAHGFVNPPYIRPSSFCVVVVRNVLDWVQHLHRTPFQAGEWSQDASISQFLRNEWSCTTNGRVLGKPYHKLGLARNTEFMSERHPMTGQRIRNVIELRTLKMMSLLKLQHLTPNCAYLRYEDMVAAGDDMMDMLQARLNMPKRADLAEVELDLALQGHPPRDLDAPLAELSEEDLRFIGAELDHETEAAFGYSYDLPR